ncbi:MAG: AMP-binding protein [Nitrospiraceae bacterium]|nr:AMP-binding protein [Nitrospiraceae bacterium]
MNDWLKRRAELSPDKIALTDKIKGNRLTYSEWNKKVNKLANFLTYEFKIKKGDIVSVLSPNNREYLDLFFACGKIGVALQNLNWRLTKFELSPLVEEAKPKIIFYGKQVEKLAKELKIKQSVELNEVLWDSFSSEFDSTVQVDWDDTWTICYTGGTTGTPKGVIITYRNITFNAINTVISWGLSNEDSAPIITPLFHTGGLNVFTTPIVYIGGENVLTGKFNTDTLFDVIDNKEINLLFGVPSIFITLQNDPHWEKTDFSHLKFVINGGAPCPLPVFKKWWKKGVVFKTGYGLTEAGPNTFWLPDRYVKQKINSVGYPLFYITVKTVNDKGEECGVDEEGELLIKGPHVTPGYFKRDEETKKTIINGWLHTGDIAYRDSDGCYFIAGRKKELIISGGENIYPAEIESILISHPKIKEAAVIGTPDEKWGEVPRAIIAVKDNFELSREEVRSFLKERVSSYKVPKSFVFLSEIPKTPVGKTDKTFLKKKYG